MTTITGEYRLFRHVHIGDTWTVDGVEIGRVEELEIGGIDGSRIEVIPALLYSSREVAYYGKCRNRRWEHLTNQTFPCHDLPAVWPVKAFFGVRVVAHPGLQNSQWGMLRGKPVEVQFLPAEPGQR